MLMYPFHFSSKKYPSWCTCCEEQPKFLNNRFDAYYHNKRKKMSPKKKSKVSNSPSAASNEHTPQSKKRAAAVDSEDLDLFHKNCDPGGSIYKAQATGKKNYFETTVELALQGLSMEDKLSVFEEFTENSRALKVEKAMVKEHYDKVYAYMPDMEWKDYVEDFKKQHLVDGVEGNYIKSDEELENEVKKLRDIITLINNELIIRAKTEKDKIWRTVVSKIEETKVYEMTNTPQAAAGASSSLPRSGSGLTRAVSQGGEGEQGQQT